MQVLKLSTVRIQITQQLVCIDFRALNRYGLYLELAGFRCSNINKGTFRNPRAQHMKPLESKPPRTPNIERSKPLHSRETQGIKLATEYTEKPQNAYVRNAWGPIKRSTLEPRKKKITPKPSSPHWVSAPFGKSCAGSLDLKIPAHGIRPVAKTRPPTPQV